MSQPAQIGMEVDAMDVIVCDRQQERREWRALLRRRRAPVGH